MWSAWTVRSILCEGVLRIAIVALSVLGYRVKTAPGHQQTVIQLLALGLADPEMFVFDAHRRKRSMSLYSAEHEPTEI